MFTINNIIYADAGNLLIGNNKIGYQFVGKQSEFKEEKIKYDDIVIKGAFIYYDNNKLSELIPSTPTYAYFKSKIIKRRYSNDDQLAILLNKDESEEDNFKYNKMQEWRNWASILAKAFINKLNELPRR